MKDLITKIDSRISNLHESSSDSDSSSESSSDSYSSENRFSNDHELTRKRTASNKGLMINIPNYLSKLSPTTSLNDLSTRLSEEPLNGRGRGVSFSQRLKNNNMLVDSMNKDLNKSTSSVDIPMEFKEIIRSRSNSRTNSINNIDQLIVGDKSRTTSFGELLGVTRSNSNKMMKPVATSATSLKKIGSSGESIHSLKKSTSSLSVASQSQGPISMKNLKKYLATGDDVFLTDDMSDEDLFMNNLSHQQLKNNSGDVMVNMTSSADLYAMDNDAADDIERIKKNTKVVSSNVIDDNYGMPFDFSARKAEFMSETESVDLNAGLTFGGKFGDANHPESEASNSTIKANNMKAYKKIASVDLYGDDEDVNEGYGWFLGSNV